MSHTPRNVSILAVACCITATLGASAVARAEMGRLPDTGWTCTGRVMPYGGAIRTDLGMIEVSGAEVVIDPANAFVRVLEGDATVPVEIRVSSRGSRTLVYLPVPLDEGRYRFQFDYGGCPGSSRQVHEYEAISAASIESLGTLRAMALMATNVRHGSPELIYFVNVELSADPDLTPWHGVWDVGLTVDGAPSSERATLDYRVSWRLPIDCPPRGTPTDPRELALEAGGGAPGAEPSLFAQTTAYVDCDSAIRVDPTTLAPLTDEEAASWDTEPPPAPPPAPPSGSVDAGPRIDAAPGFHDAGGADPDSHRRESHESCSATSGAHRSTSAAVTLWVLAFAAILLRRAASRRRS